MSSGSVNGLVASKVIAGVAFWASTGIAAARHALKIAINNFMVMPLCPEPVDGSPCRRARRRRLQDELLHAPGFDLAEDDFVWITAVHHVDHLESRRDLPRFPEPAQHFAIQLGL